jgi:hypothetical protein
MFAAKAEIVPLAVHPAVHPILEAKRSSFQRDDGLIRDFSPKKHEVKSSYSVADGKGMTLESFDASAKELGEGLGRQFWQQLFAAVEEATDATGNQVKISNGEITREAYLQMIAKTAHGFDEQGKPTNMFILSPEVGKKLEAQHAEWSKDPAFTAEVAAIQRRKKEEWDEREARRRLVE